MYIFGITGPTGAGKSTISEMFRKNGIYVADADKAAREVTKKGTACLKEICDAFGDGILNSDGTLNRAALGGVVFRDTKKLDILTRITHKYINEYIADDIKRQDAEIAAIDGAVIIGSPVQDICRALVVVTADTAARIERIMQRDGISRDAAQQRINSQMPQSEYIKFADYVIENNGNLKIRGEQVEQICNEIKNAAKEEVKASAT